MISKYKLIQNMKTFGILHIVHNARLYRMLITSQFSRSVTITVYNTACICVYVFTHIGAFSLIILTAD